MRLISCSLALAMLAGCSIFSNDRDPSPHTEEPIITEGNDLPESVPSDQQVFEAFVRWCERPEQVNDPICMCHRGESNELCP